MLVSAVDQAYYAQLINIKESFKHILFTRKH